MDKMKLGICKKNEDNSLTVADIKKLQVELNENTMTLYAKYKGKQYEVLNQSLFSYIVLD